MEYERPNPDELLKQVQKEERERSLGKLKIFLGYSAGVGKTYSMLEDAQHRKTQGTDIVVACVESHGRKETERLLIGLETIPQKVIEYRGMSLREVDLDAVLTRAPQLVLVDELAHTNAPGTRHSKRYQDVQELLAAGIDVYTTLNIQHLESMNDAVAQISGIKVKETIPDSVLEEADEIKIVDLPPDELIQRFREGKVYIPDQAAIAIEKFFNEGNLIALREMTFRRAAEHIDEQMLEYMQTRSIPGPWPAGETLLVCIGNSKTLNDRLIRTGRRLADELKADWHALYVETPAHNRLTRRERVQAMRGLEKAVKMGAKTSTSFGVTIAEEVVRFAKKNNVTRIIVGRPIRPLWQELLFGSVANQIVRISGSIDILIISSLEEPEKETGETEKEAKKSPVFVNYFLAVWMVLILTIIALIVEPYISSTNIVMLYLIGVVVAALAWGLWFAIFTSGVSVLVYDLVFVPPFFSFRVHDTEYLITFAAFLVVGVVISLLVIRTKEYGKAAQRRDDYTSTLFALSLDLASVNETETALEVVSGHIMRACHCLSTYLLPVEGRLSVAYANGSINMDEKEITAASWTFFHGLTSGKDTDTLASASLRYYPLRTPNGIVGVMGIQPEEQRGIIMLEQERLILAFASQIAMAIERNELWNQIRKNEMMGQPNDHGKRNGRTHS